MLSKVSARPSFISPRRARLWRCDTPAYYPFFSMVERADRSVVEVSARRDAEGIYRIDVDGVDRAFGEGAGSLVLCNPWNPTGRSLSVSEIEEVVAVVASHDGRIISDEIHAVLTYEGSEHVPAASVDPETVVTVTSASKAWNPPGLKCAQVVLTNDADIAPWSDYFTLEKRVAVGTFGLVASAAAYDDGEAFLNEVMVRLEVNRKLLGDLIATHLPDVEYTPPEATYLASQLRHIPIDPHRDRRKDRCSAVTIGDQLRPGRDVPVFGRLPRDAV